MASSLTSLRWCILTCRKQLIANYYKNKPCVSFFVRFQTTESIENESTESSYRHSDYESGTKKRRRRRKQKLPDFSGLPGHLRKRIRSDYVGGVHEAPRRLFGRYGFKSGINPLHIWPSERQIQKRLEYESLDPTFEELVERDKKEREFREMVVSERAKTVEEKMRKMPELIEKFRESVAKRVEVSSKEKESALQLQEDAREHFGFNISKQDPRYQEWRSKRVGEIKKEKKLKREEEKKSKKEKSAAAKATAAEDD